MVFGKRRDGERAISWVKLFLLHERKRCAAPTLLNPVGVDRMAP